MKLTSRPEMRVVGGATLMIIGIAIEQTASGIVSLVGSLLFLIGAFFVVAYALTRPPAQQWRRFNVAARVLGIWFTSGGIVALGWSVHYRLHPEQSAPMSTLSDNAVIDALIMGSFAICVGLSLLLVRPYRPDLQGSAPRAWWTGEPMEY